MDVVVTVEELASARAGLAGRRIGLVPTMGFLHDGHLSLVHAARQACEAVVVSIFVNPAQFGPGEDLTTYPSDLERDLQLLEEAGVDIVWTPRVEDVYPPGFATTVEVAGLTDELEGAQRPGHFRGVTTVVAVLFGAVGPDAAFFGAKDAQQAVVLRRMAADLFPRLEIVVAPTVREPDGLAMSSRNTYLDPQERQAALVLSRSLQAAQTAWEAGERGGDALRETVAAVLAQEPLADVDYVSVADPHTLAELDDVDPGRGALVSLAVRLGRTRLIDNTVVRGRC